MRWSLRKKTAGENSRIYVKEKVDNLSNRQCSQTSMARLRVLLYLSISLGIGPRVMSRLLVDVETDPTPKPDGLMRRALFSC